MNVTRPSGRMPRVAGLAASCSSAAKRMAPPRVSSSASGSRQQLARPRRRARPARPRPPRAARPASSTSSVWSWTSRWWKTFCSTPRRAAELGQHGGGEAELVHQLQPATGRSPATIRLSSANTRSAATPASSGARAADLVRGRPGRPRARARSRAAPRAACAAGPRPGAAAETIRSRRASRSARPPCGSTSSPPPSGSAIALTVKSRAARSAARSPSRSAHEVDVPGVAAPDDAPRAERARQLERRAARRAGDRARRGLRVARRARCRGRWSRGRAGGRARRRRRATPARREAFARGLERVVHRP